ncbi:MAG: hypothetical protein IKB36_01895 [Clostridia bacterium]|nr:hypothetical protein [Clostridia bacterium]
MSNCPKCNEKLSPFYMKQNCPKCNTNLVYYDLDNRLKADHEKAMKEQATVDRVLNNIKTSAFGGKEQITRFILMFSPLLWMCLPMYSQLNRETFETTNISLITLIKSIIATVGNADNGAMTFDMWLSDKAYFCILLLMACIIIFSLADIISSLFSIGKNALKRNMIFHIINFVIFFAVSILPIIGENGIRSSIGVIFTFISYLSVGSCHKIIDKKLNIQ